MRNNSNNYDQDRYNRYYRFAGQQEQRNQDRRPHGRDQFIRGDDEGYVEPHYRSEEYDRRPAGNYSREDYYNAMYDISNYDANPRSADYGHQGWSGEGFARKVRHYPMEGDPYREERTHLRYNMGYNPNYDNPEEGDTYRNFDSRGNHGFRHDASYGNSNEFRDFGDDRYGESYDRRARYNNNDRDYFR